jgi:hypothetical protein
MLLRLDRFARRVPTLLPTAAWFFMFIICSFFALLGEKRTHEGQFYLRQISYIISK